MNWRDNIELTYDKNINLLLTHGALGDMISSLPAAMWARRSHSLDLLITVWVPKHAVDLVGHLIGGTGIRIKPLDEFSLRSTDPDDAGPGVMNGVKGNYVTRNRFDMVDYAFATMLDMQPDFIDQRNYPHWAPLGEKPLDEPYVVIPVGATNEPSMFHPEIMAPIIEWLVANGYKPVLTGKSTTSVVMLDKGKPIPLEIKDEVAGLPQDIRGECLDLRDKTTLLEMRDWCGHAAAVVGIDGGTLHLAGTTEVPIVYGCTRVSPRHRSITRNNERNWNLVHVEPRELECSGCQSNWNLLFQHDFSKCMYKDSACTHKLHPEDFILAMQNLGL